MNKCEQCGKEFMSTYLGRPEKQKYCGTECKKKARRERERKNKKETLETVTRKKEDKKKTGKAIQELLCTIWHKRKLW